MLNREDYNRDYYKAHRNKILARKRERYQENKEIEAERYRAWYEFNLDHKKEYDKQRNAKKKIREEEKYKEMFIVRFDR